MSTRFPCWAPEASARPNIPPIQADSVTAMADPEAGWERFRADIRGSRTVVDSNQKPKLQFHIPIRPQAPKYRPGSGPPPPRINLRPVHDSNAFIVDKVVLPRGPFPPNSKILQRRCYYIIGWPDLPAARPVVDASKILEYVSPRTLEDWEYQDALRREEEREAAEAAEEAARRALAKGKSVAMLVGGTTQPGAKRRPERPPKSRMMVAEPPSEPELNSEQEELIHKRMRGPSLSTPQKSRLAQLQAEEEMLEGLEATDEDVVPAIRAPLGTLGESESANTSDGDVKKEVVEDLDELRLSSGAPGMSSRESSRASSARPVPAHQASAPGMSAVSEARLKFPVSTTPIPLPSAFVRMKNWKPKAKIRGGGLTTALSPKVIDVQGSAPTHPQSDPIHGQGSSSADLPSHTNGFTPIGGTFPRPPKRTADGSPPSDNAPVKSKPRKSKKKKQADLPLVDPGVAAAETADSPNSALDLAQGEQEYVVKRLEGDQIQDGIHWFRVRWEGDWPEEENPTWEPRENIAEKLVKQYLKRKAKREAERHAKLSAKKSKMKQTNLLADQAKAYGSVMEAFEGQMSLDGAGEMDFGQADAHNGHAHSGDDGPDELLVIEGDRELAAIERHKAARAELAAQLAGMARSVPRNF